MSNNSKKLGEVFSDYKTNSNIKYANIKGLNVIKKTNTLQIILYYDEYLEIKEIWYFENFLKERFKFEQIDTKIEYHESVQKKSIEEEWKNIIAYMSHKYPLTKPMLLLKSNIEIKDNIIVKVNMHIKGAEFLKAKKTDKELERVLKNLFGIDYKVELNEQLQKEDILEIKQNIEEVQKNAIKHIEQENIQRELNKEQSVPEYNDPDYMPPQDIDGYIPENIEEVQEENEQVNYIMGKATKAKENKVKIKDIGSDNGRVTIEGRVLTCECKQTKSGKGMIIFDIYDGTGTITCKSFAKDFEEGNQITQKNRRGKNSKNYRKSRIRHICWRYNSNCKYNY